MFKTPMTQGLSRPLFQSAYQELQPVNPISNNNIRNQNHQNVQCQQLNPCKFLGSQKELPAGFMRHHPMSVSKIPAPGRQFQQLSKQPELRYKSNMSSSIPPQPHNSGDIFPVTHYPIFNSDSAPGYFGRMSMLPAFYFERESRKVPKKNDAPKKSNLHMHASDISNSKIASMYTNSTVLTDITTKFRSNQRKNHLNVVRNVHIKKPLTSMAVPSCIKGRWKPVIITRNIMSQRETENTEI